jgi:ribose/xylose/arabinose/galactoside ABC-type transport system permease subunit
MEWTATNLSVQALVGFAGAHCAAAALQDHRFGAIGHSLVGLVAGALSGYFLQVLS